MFVYAVIGDALMGVRGVVRVMGVRRTDRHERRQLLPTSLCLSVCLSDSGVTSVEQNAANRKKEEEDEGEEKE